MNTSERMQGERISGIMEALADPRDMDDARAYAVPLWTGEEGEADSLGDCAAVAFPPSIPGLLGRLSAGLGDDASLGSIDLDGFGIQAFAARGLLDQDDPFEQPEPKVLGGMDAFADALADRDMEIGGRDGLEPSDCRISYDPLAEMIELKFVGKESGVLAEKLLSLGETRAMAALPDPEQAARPAM